MKVTLDTNCFFDYFERDPKHITKLIDLASRGHIELAMTTRVMADTLDKWKNPGISPIWTKILTFPLLKTISTGFRLNSSHLSSYLDSGDFLVSDEDVKDEARLRKIMPEAQLEDIDHLFGHISAKRDLFITSDSHFLDHAEELKQEYGVVVLKPEDALQEIEKVFLESGEAIEDTMKSEVIVGLQTIELRIEENLATITLNRLKALNAINLAMVGELGQAVRQVRNDPGVRVVVVTGAGDKAFAAGADITEFRAMSPIDAWMFVQRLQRLFLEIERLPKPVIAAVNGYALGGGCELMMACDIVYASETARIGQPEINLGIIPGAGGTQRLARLIGKQRVKELVLTGEMIGAQEAWDLGLLNKVVPAGQLMVEVRKLADKLAAKGPLAVKAAKTAIEDGYDMALEQALAHEAQLFALCFATEDKTEGVNAFLEKRPPTFKGK